MKNSAPFDPPYTTFLQTAGGMQVLRTLADGTVVPLGVGEAPLPLQRQPAMQASPGSGVVPLRPQVYGNDQGKQYLDVPFAEKDDAKRLGARWDSAKRRWYVPQGVDADRFGRWSSDRMGQ